MIERMTDIASPAIGLRASGTVTASDYRNVVIPALEQEFKARDKVRLVYVMGPELEGFEPSAMWQDTLFGLRHYFDFDKIAVVTDHKGWARTVTMMGYLIPGAVRVFPMAELDTAKSWAAT